jgi:hypothetical protein
MGKKTVLVAKVLEITSRLRNDEKERLIDNVFDMDKFEPDDLLASDQHISIN